MTRSKKVKYSPHHFDHPEGHLYFDVDGPCTIGLIGAASMSQAMLDKCGKAMAEALNEKGLTL